MKKYTYYCGLKDKDGKTVSVKRYRDTLDYLLDGYTEIPCSGVWKGEREPSVKFEVMVTEGTGFSHSALAGLLAKRGNQETVMWTEETIEVNFS